MYLMYVDESGDCGLPANGSCTNLFCLSGLVVHELRWRDVLADLAAFRRQLWQQFRINIEDDLHAGDMINKPSSLAAPLRSLWNNPLKVRHPAGGFICDNQPIRVVIEDPILRDSRESYFIQAADCVAYLLKQSIEPCGYMKKHGGNAYFKRMESVLCKHASRKDPLGFGVVRL